MGSSQTPPRPLEVGETLEIVQRAIQLIVGRVQEGKITSTLGDLVRLVELEREISAGVAAVPREVTFKWVKATSSSGEQA